MRGNAGGYGMGAPSYGGINSSPSEGGNALDAIRQQTSKIEDMLDSLAEPVKPYMPAIGRFLIVVTFLEDALRIITQWSDQILYLHDYRHIPNGLTHLFLIANVLAMVACSVLVIARRYSEYAVAGLIGVVVTQALGYGLIFDLNFFLRNLSVMGGLLMVLSDSWVRKTKAFAGLPQIEEKDRKMYFQFAGRVLLIFLFVGFVFSGQWSIWRVLVSVIGLVACVMVVVGFKAKWSATLLVFILSVFNVLVNNFWTLHEHHPHKDFAKYDFFQILSIVGGLLLLVNSGPGQFSIDEKKKAFVSGALGAAVDPIDVDLEQRPDGEPPHGRLHVHVVVLADTAARVAVRAELAPQAAVPGQREVHLATFADGAGSLNLDHVNNPV
ncbi:hypothetical protein diail_5500, partial [Diaporthe ilicicola]